MENCTSFDVKHPLWDIKTSVSFVLSRMTNNLKNFKNGKNDLLNNLHLKYIASGFLPGGTFNAIKPSSRCEFIEIGNIYNGLAYYQGYHRDKNWRGGNTNSKKGRGYIFYNESKNESINWCMD